MMDLRTERRRLMLDVLFAWAVAEVNRTARHVSDDELHANVLRANRADRAVLDSAGRFARACEGVHGRGWRRRRSV